MVRIHGRQHPVKAQIENVFGLSGHADHDGLIDWLGHLERPPRSVFLTHGEEEAALALQEDIRKQFGFAVSVPKYGAELDLNDD